MTDREELEALRALRERDRQRAREHERMLELDDHLEDLFACGDPARDLDVAIESREWGE